MEYADGLLSKIMGDGLEWTVMTTQAPAVLNTFQMEMFIFVYIITLNCITSLKEHVRKNHSISRSFGQ